MLSTLQRRSVRAVFSKGIELQKPFQGLQAARNGLMVPRRSMSSYLDIDDDLDNWPKSRRVTVINVCSQGEQMVVERLGKLNDVKTGGWFFAIPLIDSITYVVDMREKALSITPQNCITKDNVHVQVSGTLYCQFIDAEKAAYGSKNPIYAVKQLVQSSMRAAIGELELDQVLHSRKEMNTIIKTSVEDAALNWGLEIKRYEITEVTPDTTMTDAMNKQAAAERERRKKVLEAEGDKRQAELQSEGEKIRMVNVSEGELIKIKNEAEGRKVQLILEAEGEAAVIEMRATAQAQAIETVAVALQGSAGAEAAKLHVAREYISMYSEMGQKSNTMIFSDKPADINALLAQASAVLSANKSVVNV
jgi:regulator of protease activity HflC (stomatin/prohibitin superfamily)